MADQTTERLLEAGVSNEFLRGELAKGQAGTAKGNVFDPQDYEGTLAAWQSRQTPDNPSYIAPTSPYDSVADSIGNPVDRPDDLLGIRDQIKTDLGVQEKLDAVTAANKALTDFDLTTGERQQLIGDRTVSTAKLTGIQKSDAEKRELQRQGYSNDLSSAQSTAQAVLDEANIQYGIRESQINETKALMQQYTGAGITTGDSFESAMAKAEVYIEKKNEEAKEEATLNSYRDAYTQVYGYPPKESYDISKLRSKVKKKSKSAQKAAEQRADQEWQMKVDQHNMSLENSRSLIGSRNAKTQAAAEKERQETLVAQVEESVVNSIQQMVQSNSPRSVVENFAGSQGYDLDSLAGDYNIDVSGLKEGFGGSGQGFFSNLWSGTKGVFGF